MAAMKLPAVFNFNKSILPNLAKPNCNETQIFHKDLTIEDIQLLIEKDKNNSSFKFLLKMYDFSVLKRNPFVRNREMIKKDSIYKLEINYKNSTGKIKKTFVVKL
jgi:hypothetical protein